MTTFTTLGKIALSFPEVTVDPHFEKISFRVKNKIFATYDEKNARATLKLSEEKQSDFSAVNPAIYPVDNKWGQQGWTIVELSEVDEQLLSDVLVAAYCIVAPKKLGEQLGEG
ncbi:MmcQ/YjbR family DNA-binding protein [Fulvivirga ligni]|uniref:MmcQ/YjbR family DNA-binding protein n=1 Tax=Fulvivirga ligni TaxID=2904246 RepID=UPI001F41324E|nr:MmcQ/YjbR family DNA-binding protein [Fulvivirga ligni]UII21303.1 MmcQ/YjbR family DNA-binding protein [Fulvivirga ligni]